MSTTYPTPSPDLSRAWEDHCAEGERWVHDPNTDTWMPEEEDGEPEGCPVCGGVGCATLGCLDTDADTDADPKEAA